MPEIRRLNRAMKRPLPDGFREDFRRESRPMMKYTNILSFNTRTIVLFATLLAGLPWIYFVFELTVMNILLICLLHTYGNICKRFTLRLRGDDRH